MTQKEELRILRSLLWKIGNSTIGAQKDGGKNLEKIISAIRYQYCYPQSHSHHTQTEREIELIRISGLNILDKL